MQILDFEANRYYQPSDQLEAGWNFDGIVDLSTVLFADVETGSDVV